MEDVKTPHQLKPTMTPLVSSVLAKWLTAQGLGDLMSAIVSADQRDTWSLDREPDIIGREMEALCVALSTLPATSSGSIDPARLSSDLTYVLGYLRTSQSVQLLCLFNARCPGIVDNLLAGVTPTRHARASRVESALLANRILYLVRHHAAPGIFSPERLLEVKAAIAAARLAGRNS
jgi:hypothetical protein